MHVAPGDDSEIAVSFDTHFQKGHQVRTITASTNDPNNPQVAMTLQGIVKKQVEAQPNEISFGDVKKGTEAHQPAGGQRSQSGARAVLRSVR